MNRKLRTFNFWINPCHSMKLPKSTIYLLGAIAFGLVSAVLIAMTVLSIKYELPAKSILIRIFASSMFLILFFMRLNRYTYYRNIEKRGVPEPRVLPKPLPAAYKAPWTPSVPWIFIPISYALVGISLVGLVFYFLGYHPGWTILHASKLVKPGGPEIPM